MSPAAQHAHPLPAALAAQVTNFDRILVLIIGDGTQQALIGDDYSIAGGLVAVSTPVILDAGLARAKVRWPAVDVLTAAREAHGLPRMDEIAFAVREQSGGISIVPARPEERPLSPGT